MGEISKDQFLSRVAKQAKAPYVRQKNVAPRRPFVPLLARTLGWAFAVVGISLAALFLYAMVSAHETFGPLIDSGVAKLIESGDDVAEQFSMISLEWLPLFARIYGARYLIVAVELILFAGLSASCFLFAHGRSQRK